MDSCMPVSDLNRKTPSPEFLHRYTRPQSPRFNEGKRFEDQGKDKPTKLITKDLLLNNAFCDEQLKDEGFMQKCRIPTFRAEGTWVERVLEKERKFKKEEAKIAHERLRTIEKRTKYIEREILSPSTKARNMLEPIVVMPRSNSKKEIISIEDRGSIPSSEISDKPDQVAPKRLMPRSMSRKEKGIFENRASTRSPFPRQTISPLKIIYN